MLLVIHGGFWSSAYDSSHMAHLCETFTSKEVITCNLEYRRVGDPGGGWPGTFHDVAKATDYIFEKVSRDPRFDLGRTAALGFSAGAHLALWLSSRHRVSERSPIFSTHKGVPISAVSLAGVSDLKAAWRLHLGNGATERLMGGTPEEVPEQYHAGSPIELLPTGVKQVLIHGMEDEIVPISQSERFVERARDAGDKPLLLELENTGHFELVDPESSAWPRVNQATLQLLGWEKTNDH